MKLKNFFNWLAWLEHKDETRATIVVYGFIVAIFVLIFFPFWLISGDSLKALGVGLVISVLSGILAGFISSCFFSDIQKNWKIAIHEALKVVDKHSLYCLEYPEYGKKMAVLIGELREMKKKNPAELNSFVKPYRDLFEARKALIVLNDEQTRLCKQILESKDRIRAL